MIKFEMGLCNNLLDTNQARKTCPIVYTPAHAALFLTHKKHVRVHYCQYQISKTHLGPIA